MQTLRCFTVFFFFNDTATTEIYTLSLHDALPIYELFHGGGEAARRAAAVGPVAEARVRSEGSALALAAHALSDERRSEEHTSELQSRQYLVCRLLLEKKKTIPCQYSSTSVTPQRR